MTARKAFTEMLPRFQPPLVITQAQIDRALEAFSSALAEVAPATVA